MDTMAAVAMGIANRNKEPMVFDWHKAATLIKDSNAKTASAGLRGDWSYTGGEIFSDGSPVPHSETYVYLSSTWATPEIEIDGRERIACYLMKSATPPPGWDADTYWPDSALKILEGK